MAKPAAARALPVYEIPAHRVSAWDAFDLRRHCRDCRNKSGAVCAATRKPINASPLPMYCDLYSARGNR